MTTTFYSGIVSESALSGTERITINGISQSRQVLMPMHSSSEQIFMPSIKLLSIDNVNPNLFASTSAQRMTIRRNDITSMKHLHARITVTVSGAPVTLAPLPFWFSQIDYRTSSDNDLIASMFSDTTAANMGILIGSGKMKSFYKTLNFDHSAGGYLGCTAPLPPGIHTFYLPLFMNSVLGNFHQIFLADSKQDHYFDFFPSNPIVSGSGTIQVSNFQFALETNRLEDKDVSIFRNRYKTYLNKCTFLDAVCTPFPNRVLNLGAVNLFNLISLNGLCAYQMIVVRAAGAKDVNTGAANWNWLNVGDNEGATIDLVDNVGSSIWANGSNGVSTKFMRTHQAADMCDSAFLTTKPVYNAVYCDDIRKALLGQVKGAYRFVGTNVQLSLNLPASSAVQEIQTVTFSAVPASTGFYRLSFRGEVSVNLAANATPAQIAAAFAGIKTASSQYYSLVASGPLGAGLSTTFTFTHPATSGLEGDLVSVLSDGMGASVSTARTTAGTSGLVAGGAYDVHIYSYMYKSGSFVDGQIRSVQK